MSLEQADLDSIDLSDLQADEWEQLRDWEKKYAAKYPIVGELVAASDLSHMVSLCDLCVYRARNQRN